MNVYVKYCGNCNPQVDGPEIVKKIRYRMKSLVTVDLHDCELLLVVSGCLKDCAKRPNVQVPEVVVAGASIDHTPVTEAKLPEILINKLEAIKHAMARNI